jgi:hypothetical protein
LVPSGWIYPCSDNRYWNSINLRQNFDVTLHDLKICVWCITVAIQIVDPHILNRLLIQGGMSMISFDLFWEHNERRRDIWLFYARWCYKTHTAIVVIPLMFQTKCLNTYKQL